MRHRISLLEIVRGALVGELRTREITRGALFRELFSSSWRLPARRSARKSAPQQQLIEISDEKALEERSSAAAIRECSVERSEREQPCVESPDGLSAEDIS